MVTEWFSTPFKSVIGANVPAFWLPYPTSESAGTSVVHVMVTRCPLESGVANGVKMAGLTQVPPAIVACIKNNIKIREIRELMEYSARAATVPFDPQSDELGRRTIHPGLLWVLLNQINNLYDTVWQRAELLAGKTERVHCPWPKPRR